MKKFQILVGTVSGTALTVAEKIQQALTDAGHLCEINQEAEETDLMRDPEEIFLICSATTGEGDLPTNILPLYIQLTNNFPAINHRQYGIIGLGDSSYMNYNQAAQSLDAAFMDIGAIRTSEPLLLDALLTNTPADDALKWLPSWIRSL